MEPADAARILLRRRRMRATLEGFAQSIQIPGAPVGGDDSELFAPVGTGMAAHHSLLCRKIQTCLETRYGRLIIMLPPGAAKSTYASSIAPAWGMAKWPGWQAMTVSYGTELAKKHARKARSIFKQAVVADAFGGVALDRSTSAAELWRLSNGSEYMAAGILAGITGSRADAIFGDDLIAGAQEADSPATRQATQEAWEMDVMTRLKPGGSVVLLGTRWHPLDPIGALLPHDYAGQSGPVLCTDGMVWEVVCIPAECEREDDPLGRKPGEMLWPEWFDAEHWKPHRAKPRNWAALFQQRPTLEGGGRFKAEWIQWFDEGQQPEHLNRYAFSDWGAPSETTQDADYTVHGIWGLDPDGHLWALDWWREQGASTSKGMDAMFGLAALHRPFRWWNEKGPIWNALAPVVKDRSQRKGPRIRLETLPSSVNKVARAESFFAMAEEGRIHLPRTPWAEALVKQLIAFPVVSHDDDVDVCSLAGRALMNMVYAHVPSVPKDSDLKFGSVAWLMHEDRPLVEKDRVM